MIIIEIIFALLCAVLTATIIIGWAISSQLSLGFAIVGVMLVALFAGMFILLIRELRNDNDNNKPTI